MRMVIFMLCLWQFSFVTAQSTDPVLFTVGDDPVYLSEFKYIYEKNNADKADYSKESLSEYLELYKKFKLKVKRARAIGLDTIQALNDELAGYRKQLAKSYLKDKEISDNLIREVVDRMKEDVEVSHIFVSAPGKTTDEQKAAAEKKINDIYDKLKENNGNHFSDMAKTLSEDKVSALKGGKLGYYTAPLPDGFYNFEDAMYETAVGSYSKPIRSKMGYHIIYVTNKRPARGQMEIAHILFRYEKSATLNEEIKIKADSVYNLLKEGRNFETFAAKFSDDTKTKSNGGYLGFFGINQYEAPFEDAAFDLQNDNDYTKPVETKLGLHIIKRISKRDDSNEEKLTKRIETRINNTDRFGIAEEKLIEDVKNEAGFSDDRMALKRFTTALDENFYTYKWDAPEYNEDLILFSLADKKFSLNSFGKFLKTNIRERLKYSKSTPYETAAEELYADFVKEKVMEYEESNLEKKYPDFKALMQEYREGILLFEITKQEVWDKASQDTVGLKQFYESNTDNYMWPERVKVYKYTITTDDKNKADSAYDYAEKKDHNKFIEKYENDKTVEMTYKTEVLSVDDKAIMELERKKNAVSPVQVAAPSIVFYKYIGMEAANNKSLSEARGYVIADYQDKLEMEWIEELMNMYTVSVDNKVLKSITK
jgi:peptidyl-prolyl cis-trans isomerase SurA